MEDARPGSLAILVAARNEVEVIGETVKALHDTFPEAVIRVADDGSTDGTAEAARRAGAEVVSGTRRRGKGANMTAGAIRSLASPPPPAIVLLCDGDLGCSAGRLAPLVAAVANDECDLAVGTFVRRVGGGFGFAVGFARWAIRRRCGFEPAGPISGQRAMRREVLDVTLPFAPGYGMETGMTIDAVRAGCRLREYEIDLSHRATGKTPAGFLHRFRQLLDFVRVWWARRDSRDPQRRATGT